MPNPYIMPRMKYMESDPALQRREALAKIALENNNRSSVYIPAVYCVNHVLQKMRLGLSHPSYESIVNNINLVNRGERFETSASLIETMSFARDAVNSIRKGEFGMALVDVAGCALNLAGGTLYSANYDRMRLPPHQRHIYDMFDFIHS